MTPRCWTCGRFATIEPGPYAYFLSFVWWHGSTSHVVNTAR